MFYQLQYIPNREKYNKHCNMHPVILPFVNGGGGLSVSVKYLLSDLRQQGTPIYHSQPAYVKVSIFIYCYTKIEIIILTEGLIEQHPDNQFLQSSHSGIAVQSRFVIFLFSKQFSSLRILSCIQYLDFFLCL